MAQKLKLPALVLLVFATLLWGGTALFFNIILPKSFQGAKDGTYWKNAGSGLVPTSIGPDGPADRAGLLSTDTLLLANGVSITSDASLQEVINQVPTGQRAIYTVRRGDGLVRLEVEIQRDTFELFADWLLKLAGSLYILLAILVFEIGRASCRERV